MKNKITYILFLLFLCSSVNAQFIEKKNLYLNFAPDSDNYKLIREQKPIILNKQYFPERYEIYGLRFKSEDGKNYIYRLIYSAINVNRYTVTDSVALKNLKIIPFKNLLFLKGIKYDTSDKKNFPYATVYIIEKITKSQYKIIQVQTYIGSDEIGTSPVSNK